MGTIELDKMICTFSEYDIGILYFENIYTDKEYINISEPNKMFEYYFAQLPILCNFSSSYYENIVKHKLGISVELRNEQNLYSKLSSLIKSYKHNNTVYQSFDDQKSQNIINTLIRRY